MGRIANALAGTIGTAVVTTNCFFAGSNNDDIIASQEIASEYNLSNGSEAVVYIGSAPSEGIDLRDYLSDTGDVIGQAFEDAEKHDDRQEANDIMHDMENNEQTSGSAPPNNDNIALNSGETVGADLSAENTSGSAAVDYNNDMSDFGSLDDSEGYIDSSELSDDEENSEEDGMSM